MVVGTRIQMQYVTLYLSLYSVSHHFEDGQMSGRNMLVVVV